MEPTDKKGAGELVESNFSNLVDKGHVNSVYGEPMQVGDSLIIPAAEIVSAGGFGFGEGENGDQGTGEPSGGGGGGGYAFSRPVAMVVVNQDGVQVQQVLDLTKITLAAITALGFMVSTMASIYRFRKQLQR